jgi:hypothetical protein
VHARHVVHTTSCPAYGSGSAISSTVDVVHGIPTCASPPHVAFGSANVRPLAWYRTDKIGCINSSQMTHTCSRTNLNNRNRQSNILHHIPILIINTTTPTTLTTSKERTIIRFDAIYPISYLSKYSQQLLIHLRYIIYQFLVAFFVHRFI